MEFNDTELTRLAAERVMGWMVIPDEGTWGGEKWILPANGGVPLENPRRLVDWSPLTDWQAAGEIVEKMRADGWLCELHIFPDQVNTSCHFKWYKPGIRKIPRNGHAIENSPTRAITIAALLAAGAIKESPEAEEK